jgi:hypothetical protein
METRPASKPQNMRHIIVQCKSHEWYSGTGNPEIQEQTRESQQKPTIVSLEKLFMKLRPRLYSNSFLFYFTNPFTSQGMAITPIESRKKRQINLPLLKLSLMHKIAEINLDLCFLYARARCWILERRRGEAAAAPHNFSNWVAFNPGVCMVGIWQYALVV